MSSEIIKIIEKRMIELRNRIIKKGIFATKEEKALLEKYEKLLLIQYKKYKE